MNKYSFMQFLTVIIFDKNPSFACFVIYYFPSCNAANVPTASAIIPVITDTTVIPERAVPIRITIGEEITSPRIAQ